MAVMKRLMIISRWIATKILVMMPKNICMKRYLNNLLHDCLLSVDFWFLLIQ